MADLPIRRVVLYKHGVGYFEREGLVSGDSAVSLAFKQREVSDVLKSLTVIDRDGGTVSAVSYDSTTPIEQLLAEIALNIPDSGSLTGLLPQLKGARAAITPTGGSTVQGMILGIDTQQTNTDAGIQETPRLSLLTDNADVRSFDLFDIELTLLDEGIKRDLDFYLRTQLASKKKDARTFTLFAQGDGERTLEVSYVLEAPVWKATYRILLDDEVTEASGSREGAVQSASANAKELSQEQPPDGGRSPSGAPQPLIQGWAVVDNTSDEDWIDVRLTLVAGLPVSFVHDLYTPRFIRRPVVEVRETTGVLPPMAEAGIESVESMLMEFDDDANDQAKFARYSPAMAAAAPMRRKTMSSDRGEQNSRASAVSSVQAQTRERQVGDLFEYQIEKPVTVKRNQSALVPILLKAFAGRSVLLYQKAARVENPIRCVEFENTTGLTLEGGPVTVLEQGSYVGEAMLDTLKPKDQRLVGYAVELAVRVLDNIDSHTDRVSRVTVRQGYLKTHYAQIRKTTYTFTSKADKEQTLYLDHPRDDSNWRLVSKDAPHETTENYWRFKLPLPPNGVSRFAVEQHQTQSQSFNLSELHHVHFESFLSSKYLDKKTEAALRESFKERSSIAEIDRKIAEVQNERNQIHAEQKRIRENLGSLGERASEKELRERFVRTLGQQEDRLESILAEEKQLKVDRNAAQERLQNLIIRLDYEAEVPG